MIKSLLVVICYLSIYTCLAQHTPIPEAEAARQNIKDLVDNNNITGVIKSFDKRYEGIKGNPFYGKTWNKATLKIQNNVFENIFVKYNSYENNIHFINSNGKELMLDGNNVGSFSTVDSITQQTLNFKKLGLIGEFEPELVNKFGVALYEGKEINLVLLPDKKLLKANYKGPYSADRNYDEFVDDYKYYVVINRKPEKIKLNKKNLLEIFPSKSKQIEEFIKTKKINANSEAGWISVLNYQENL